METGTIKTDLCLPYLEAPQDNNCEEAPIAIFIHGRGANEEDLFELAPEVTSRFRVLSVRAPLKIGLQAYYWFQTQYLPSGPLHNAEEAERARLLLVQMIQQVQAKYRINSKNTFLLGFSQGAILSFAIALSQPDLIAGVVCMNGRILPEHIPSQPNPKLKDFPILVSHGTQDEILSIEYARSAKATLDKHFVDLTYLEYPMGHTITEMNFPDARDWLLKKIK